MKVVIDFAMDFREWYRKINHNYVQERTGKEAREENKEEEEEQEEND